MDAGGTGDGEDQDADARATTDGPDVDQDDRGPAGAVSPSGSETREESPGGLRAEEEDGRHSADPDRLLWDALTAAPEEGVTVPELVELTRLSRPTIYRRLREYADTGRAVQVGWGRWRTPPNTATGHDQ